MTLFEAVAIAAAVGWVLVAILALWLISQYRQQERMDMLEHATVTATMERMRQIQEDLDAARSHISAQSAAIDKQASALSASASAQMLEAGKMSDAQLALELKKRGLSA